MRFKWMKTNFKLIQNIRIFMASSIGRKSTPQKNMVETEHHFIFYCYFQYF